MNRIFVQIASYRDPELVPTIKSMLENAKKPKNLRFGIAVNFILKTVLMTYQNGKKIKDLEF